MDAIDGTHSHAGRVFYADSGLRNNVGHRLLLLSAIHVTLLEGTSVRRDLTQTK
jgi:hypothetical protein